MDIQFALLIYQCFYVVYKSQCVCNHRCNGSFSIEQNLKNVDTVRLMIQEKQVIKLKSAMNCIVEIVQNNESFVTIVDSRFHKSVFKITKNEEISKFKNHNVFKQLHWFYELKEDTLNITNAVNEHDKIYVELVSTSDRFAGMVYIQYDEGLSTSGINVLEALTWSHLYLYHHIYRMKLEPRKMDDVVQIDKSTNSIKFPVGDTWYDEVVISFIDINSDTKTHKSLDVDSTLLSMLGYLKPDFKRETGDISTDFCFLEDITLHWLKSRFSKIKYFIDDTIVDYLYMVALDIDTDVKTSSTILSVDIASMIFGPRHELFTNYFTNMYISIVAHNDCAYCAECRKIYANCVIINNEYNCINRETGYSEKVEINPISDIDPNSSIFNSKPFMYAFDALYIGLSIANIIAKFTH
ncbi:hypothetical protein A3Q56_04003 [Intoshia linei]|uniref:Uncharacterized protein n=1 Tax=Intoshia linei TaxID=1819745 RepID=A0A177B3D1_9BILA|nr:hypothetical protein A3Q56_04003 [Intoshia linei]